MGEFLFGAGLFLTNILLLAVLVQALLVTARQRSSYTGLVRKSLILVTGGILVSKPIAFSLMVYLELKPTGWTGLSFVSGALAGLLVFSGAVCVLTLKGRSSKPRNPLKLIEYRNALVESAFGGLNRKSN